MYDVIVADPPWPIKKIKRKVRPNQKEMDYSLMTLDEIRDLPVNSIANENSWLFLWTIQKHLFNAKDVLENWGFKFLCTGAWEKTYGKSAGMPLFGFQYNVEFYLVGYKGKIETYPKRKLIKLAFSAENVGHSVKPDIFYKNIEVLGEKRIDLFARRERDGWDVFGNEVNSNIKLCDDYFEKV